MKTVKPVRTLWNLLVRKSPIEAQVVITRRCNLSCGYCSEHDASSLPVGFTELCTWIDALHRLHVAHITLLGGEPMLHPNLAELVAYGRRRSTVSVTTNGFLVSDEIIDKLNAAKLNHMQVSIDAAAVDPTNYIQKTFKPLRPKLERLKKRATFDVHIAAVLCQQSKDDVRLLLKEAGEMGIPISLSIVHDDKGQRMISGEPYVSLWRSYGNGINHFGFSMIDYEYTMKLLQGVQPGWKCRAGSRSLYVDEYGNVQYCSAQRGRLNRPIAEYTRDDVRGESRMSKGCEEGCAIDCVFRVSQIDNDIGLLLKTLLHGALTGSHQSAG